MKVIVRVTVVDLDDDRKNVAKEMTEIDVVRRSETGGRNTMVKVTADQLSEAGAANAATIMRSAATLAKRVLSELEEREAGGS